MRTIAVLNQKGGVGKTTTAVNTAAALAARGLKVVVIDLDPQAHLTIHLGLEPQTVEKGAYEVLTESADFEQSLMMTRPNLWALGTNINLVGAETELVTVVGREIILREAMAACQDKFDFCLIDCAPSLGLLSLNALAASQEVLIPLQPHFLALQGFGKLLQTVDLVNKRINPELKVTGVLLCMFDTRASLPNEVRADIDRFLTNARGSNSAWSDAQLVPTFIRRNIKLAEAPSYGRTIFEYDPACNGAMDYRNVGRFFLGLEPLTDEVQQAEIEAQRRAEAAAEARRQEALQETQSESAVEIGAEPTGEPRAGEAQEVPEVADEVSAEGEPEASFEAQSEGAYHVTVENPNVPSERVVEPSPEPSVEVAGDDVQSIDVAMDDSESVADGDRAIEHESEAYPDATEPAVPEEVTSIARPWDLDHIPQLLPGHGPTGGPASHCDEVPAEPHWDAEQTSADEPAQRENAEPRPWKTNQSSDQTRDETASDHENGPGVDQQPPEQPPIRIHTVHLPSPQSYSPRPFHDEPAPSAKPLPAEHDPASERSEPPSENTESPGY